VKFTCRGNLQRIALCSYLLLATASTATLVCAQITQGVIPKELQGRKQFELGELVLFLMPNSGERSVGWDFRADSPILWKTAGYETTPRKDGTSSYTRVGIVRVHVLGKKSTVLRQRVTELGWSVTYSNTSNPNFGPQEIQVEPGGWWAGGPCFGSTYSGCDFEEPIGSLSHAGIIAINLCSKEEIGGRVSAFVLSHAGRRQTVMVWQTSGGSGGSSAWITLKLDERPNPGMCDKL
jgi:hypothetical protein